MGRGKNRWKISFHKVLSSPQSPPKTEIPKEFLCPISGSLMADPVILPSGHTFERSCIQASIALGHKPTSTLIPNLALRTAILTWCVRSSTPNPTPVDPRAAEAIVRTLMADDAKLLEGVRDRPNTETIHATSELTRRGNHFRYSSAESACSAGSTPPVHLTRPACYSSSSSAEIGSSSSPICSEEGEIFAKLRSNLVSDQEEALVSLRKMTRTREESRVSLCTPRILSAIRSSIVSRYLNLQVNSVASLVNLSLERANKVKIVRTGIVLPLIDVLKCGFPEAQEHAAGALFSLAIDDDNKTALGVLGALPVLLHSLRSDSERTQLDSAMALYHLSLVQSNRVKLVKLGAGQVLLGMADSGHISGRVLLVLCNLATCNEGRAALLDAGAVGCLVGMLKREELGSESTKESCVAILFGLSYGGLRFKGLAKEAGAASVLQKVEKSGSERAKEKARRILELLKVGLEDEEVDWEELLEYRYTSRTQSQPGSGPNSARF